MSDEPGHTIDAAPEHRAPRVGRWLTILRAVLVVIGLLALWGVVAIMWADVVLDGGPFVMEYVYLTVAAALITTVWIISLRSDVLRQALLPIEVGILFFLAMVGAGALVEGFDGTGDEYLAAIVAACVALGYGVLERVARGRSWATKLLAGATGITFVVGAVAFASIAAPSQLYGVGFDDGPIGDSGLRSVLTSDGRIVLGSPSQYGHDVYGGVVGTEIPAAMVDPGPGPSPTGAAVVEPWRHAPQLLATKDGDIEVRIPGGPLTSGSRLAVRIARGTCETQFRLGTGELVVDATRTDVLGETVVPLKRLRLADLEVGSRVYGAFGSGEPLAAVSCVDLLEPTRIALAQNGLGEFAARCIEPLGGPIVAEITEASFQDRACAKDFAEFDRLSRGHVLGQGLPDRQMLLECAEANDLDVSVETLRSGARAVLPPRGFRGDLPSMGCAFPPSPGVPTIADPASAIATTAVM